MGRRDSGKMSGRQKARSEGNTDAQGKPGGKMLKIKKKSKGKKSFCSEVNSLRFPGENRNGGNRFRGSWRVGEGGN